MALRRPVLLGACLGAAAAAAAAPPAPAPAPPCLAPWGGVSSARLVAPATVAFCTVHEDAAMDGSCWSVDLALRKVTHLPGPPTAPAAHPVTRDGAKVTICPHGSGCHTIAPAVPSGAPLPTPEVTVSEAGTHAALHYRTGDDTTWIETHDLRARKPIARFAYAPDTPCGYALLAGETVILASLSACDPRPARLVTLAGKAIAPAGPSGFSFDGSRAHLGKDLWALGGLDSRGAAVVLVNVRTGKVVGRLAPRPHEPYSLAFDLVADGKGGFLYVYGNGVVVHYDGKGKERARIDLPICRADASP